ncbi:hypothetical protein [Lysobacter soli]|uniref:hypothetical protein n=1 Tax=Lysobacter soli TaxID=453783 RepID=UPI0037CA0C4C
MSSFRWINKQGVESADGFVVQRSGRFTEEYRENDRSITIDVESGLSGGRHVVSYRRRSFDAWSSDLLERQRVIDNYRAALRFMGSVPDEC